MLENIDYEKGTFPSTYVVQKEPKGQDQANSAMLAVVFFTTKRLEKGKGSLVRTGVQIVRRPFVLLRALKLIISIRILGRRSWH